MTENCPMRHENGNCIPAGGFCTANKNICEALHNAYRMGKAQLSQEGTTKDAISRQQAIDAINHICPVDTDYDSTLLDRVDVRYVLSDLPSVQPEPQEGEWVQIQRCTGDAQPDLECPFCKHRIGWWDMGRYCAGCGAKLEGGAG